MTALQEKVADFIAKAVELETISRTEKSSPYKGRHAAALRAFRAILAEGEDGRRAIEGILDHESPEVRFWAGCEVLDWAPDLAVPVLGRLLRDPMPKHFHVDAVIDLQFVPFVKLTEFFGCRPASHNNLIEPLRAYGIELPRREERPWFF